MEKIGGGKIKLPLIKKAIHLYRLWWRVERARKKVNRLMADGEDCFSHKMLVAFEQFHTADEEWKQCRREYRELG